MLAINQQTEPAFLHLFRTLGVLAVNKNDVTYYLFNHKNYNEKIDNENLDKVDTSQPALFLIHGWKGDSNSSWMEELTDILLRKGSVNVVTVDWSGPAGDLYPISVDEVKYIGNEEACFWRPTVRMFFKANTLGNSWSASTKATGRIPPPSNSSVTPWGRKSPVLRRRPSASSQEPPSGRS